jgi:hypothetical protein
MSSARTQIEEGLSRGMVRSAWRKLPEEVQSVLSQLITRYPSSRLSASSFLAHPYFSSLLVSTLRFLERDSFAAQSSEAQASFLKGLVGVLPRFSDKVGRRKVLPTLLEETRKAGLVPFLLPNILYIGAKMDAVSTNLFTRGTVVLIRHVLPRNRSEQRSYPSSSRCSPSRNRRKPSLRSSTTCHYSCPSALQLSSARR